MSDDDRETLIRQYAADEITWHALRERGFEDYVQVLGALGELGFGRRWRPWKARTWRRGCAGGP